MSERIEKILARELNEPRSRVKTLLQKGQVTVDGVVARAGQQADPDTQEICLAGEPIACRAFCVFDAQQTHRGALCHGRQGRADGTGFGAFGTEAQRTVPRRAAG